MPRVSNSRVTEVKPAVVGGAVSMDLDNGAAGAPKKEVPEWLSKIKQGSVKKIPKHVQRKRRNYRLGKLLVPKPPLGVLNEITSADQVVFENVISDPVTHLMRITAKYDGVTFEGIGPTKNIAKNICSENILQYIAFQACKKDQNGGTVQGSHGEEETPWTALARVALFKMFNDWQAKGTQVPPELINANLAFTSHAGGAGAGAQTQVQHKPRPDKKLPEDAASRNPVQLLHEMMGPLNFETQTEGAPPTLVFNVAVTIDGQRFSGTSTNKKEAKRHCAAAANLKLYGINYVEVKKQVAA